MQDVPVFQQSFYFLRHGESTANVARIVGGTLDVALTERGHEQARNAADVLRPLGITAIYSSALRRARDTAEHISHALALPVTVIATLGERHWGALQGQLLASRVRGVVPPDAETAEQFTQRVLHGFAAVTPGGMPLIVAHSGVFRVLCRTLGIAESEKPVRNAQPVKLTPPDQVCSAWRMETVSTLS